MSARSAKRARVDSDDNAITDPSSHDGIVTCEEVEDWVYEISEEDCRALLRDAAMAHPDVLRSISDIKYQIDFEAAHTVTDFDWHSKNVWRDLNITYRGSSGFAAADKVIDSITSSIDTIVDDAGARVASFGTRQNGLEVLRKMAKSITLSSGALAHEVHMHFQWDKTLVNGMYQIGEAMSVDERMEMLCWDDGRGSWEHKLIELIGLTRGQCLFEGLKDVLELLRDEEGEEENETEIRDEDQYEDQSEEYDDDDESDDDHVGIEEW